MSQHLSDRGCWNMFIYEVSFGSQPTARHRAVMAYQHKRTSIGRARVPTPPTQSTDSTRSRPAFLAHTIAVLIHFFVFLQLSLDMDHLMPFDALVIPSDDRGPHLVTVMTSPMSTQLPGEPYRGGRMPHPEVFMDYVAEGMGPTAWAFHVVEALDCMTKKFATPYIIFYPVVSRDGMPFPVNKFVRETQGRLYKEQEAWRGNLVVMKYRDAQYSAMVNISMADFPILKNYLSTHRPRNN